MTIRHLNVFIKVCELGSISKTAEELNVAQPSVSQTIKELENYYDVVLFNRVNKKLILTTEGEILLAKAKEVSRGFAEFEEMASKRDLNPIIKIGATMTFGAFVIPRFNKMLKEEIPNANPKFYIDKPAGLEEKILRGDLDFGFEEGVINSKMIKAQHIGDDELIAICSPDFNAPDKLKLEELANFDLLLREPGNPSRRILDYQLLIKGVKLPQPRLESVSNNVILSMAMSGQGIGILPAAVARRSLQNGLIRKIELDTQLKRKLFLISHKNKIFNKTCQKAYKMAGHILETQNNNK